MGFSYVNSWYVGCDDWMWIQFHIWHRIAQNNSLQIYEFNVNYKSVQSLYCCHTRHRLTSLGPNLTKYRIERARVDSKSSHIHEWSDISKESSTLASVLHLWCRPIISWLKEVLPTIFNGTPLMALTHSDISPFDTNFVSTLASLSTTIESSAYLKRIDATDEEILFAIDFYLTFAFICNHWCETIIVTLYRWHSYWGLSFHSSDTSIETEEEFNSKAKHYSRKSLHISILTQRIVIWIFIWMILKNNCS